MLDEHTFEHIGVEVTFEAYDITRWFMRRTRRTRSDPGGAVVRQAGVKWSFEFERASWCWPLRWHSSSLGQWMSEFFMEQPETVETNESKRTSIKGFQIITDSSSRRKELTTSSMVISHWNVFFFSFFFFPFHEEKEPSFLTSGYISDPKSITSANKILVCKRETENDRFY